MNSQSMATLSWQHPNLDWLLATAAFSVLFSLLLAWLATIIIYLKVKSLKRVFPATHNLIRAHIDYLIMSCLLGVVFSAYQYLQLSLPPAIVVILCFGVIYNPLGFVVKAVKPKTGESGSLQDKIMVTLGFIPATLGYGYAFGYILLTLAG